MYDAVTSELIASAPPLPGLEPAALREELTAAFVEIAAARLALNQADGPVPAELAAAVSRMGRLADAYEARIVLGLDPDRERATAFVAASARQVVGLAERLQPADEATTRLDEDAIGGELAAALLFLIAERSSDAFEAARDIQARGEASPIRRALILCVGRLARGRLQDIVDVDVNSERLTAFDPFDYAVDLLFRELLVGVHLLARFGLGQIGGEALEAAIERFERVRALSLGPASTDDVLGLSSVSTFAGPHHLASLLIRTAGTLSDSALVRTPAPGGADAARWAEWLTGEAARWPYVWENHRRAIETGYLNCGESLVMTSPTGSGKTTLAALKIAATITSGKSVLYLAPTHALVGQVERDLNERISGVAVAESVDDTTVENILPALPTLAVVTPERCFALLTFAPELFANVGLLVFDECHLLGVARTDGSARPRVDRRGVDAMLCLLSFISTSPTADLLLLSAMVSNGPEVADWLHTLTQRTVHAFDDRWKPTRQLRACVTYDVRELAAARAAANTRGQKAKVVATPCGLFSLIAGWNPGAPDKLLFRALAPNAVPLGFNADRPLGRRNITANRFEVAATIADRFEQAGLKVIIFCDSIPTCVSTAERLNAGRAKRAAELDREQETWRTRAIGDVGTEAAIYDAGPRRAAVHHGELLPDERRLVESLFRNRESGVNVLAATSTLAQGLNLPCEVVILAGTDRIDESDAAETLRTSLQPHEILNAFGRAGRAGQAATGLSIVVPGQPIACDPDTKWVGGSPDLPVVFAEGDQCLPLSDPIATLFDQIEVAGTPSVEGEYLLRRLTVSLGEDADVAAFDSLARRTFGFYRRRVAGAAQAEAWLAQRRATLTAAIRARAEPPAQPWEEELAAKTGATRKFIGQLATAYPSAPHDAAEAQPWVEWLLSQFEPTSSDVDAFLRPETMARVFGRAYTTQPDDEARRKVGLAGLRAVVPHWFSASTLLQIEGEIAPFIVANEIGVALPTRADGRAKHARRFALRLAPDLGFICGVLQQVAVQTLAMKDEEPPPMLQALPQLIRKGFQTPYHFALSQDNASASKAEVYTEFAGLTERIIRSAADDWSTVRTKLQSAQIEAIFSEDFGGAPNSET